MKQTSINLIVLATVCILIVFAGYSGISSRSVDGDCFNHGDVNLDGAITAADAQLAFFIVLGTYSPTYEEECAADCNGDGIVTAADAQAIFLVVLGQGDCADPLIPGEYEPGDLYSTDDIVGNLRFVPSGTFTQGSPDTEDCRWSREGPQFEHTLTRNLAVMETEITRGMWEDLKAVQPTLPDDSSDTSKSPTMDHPAQMVTWYEAVLFANLLSIENGLTRAYYKDAGFTIPVDATNYTTGDFYCNFNAGGYRLPTEGEREYFTRAGTSGPFWADEPNYSSGNCNSCLPSPPLPVLDSIAWWCGNAEGTVHPVGTKLANPWGLHGVHGNVWEWCWDRTDWPMTSYPEGPVMDYTGPTTGSCRVKRGGRWNNAAEDCRSAGRNYGNPGNRFNYLGFRLLRSTG